MNKNRQSSRGFTLVELIAGVATILVLAGFLFPASTYLHKVLAKAEVETAAEILRLDLTRLQHRSMLAGPAVQEFMLVDADHGGYKFARNESEFWYQLRFNQTQAGKVRFADSRSARVQFGFEGGPGNMVKLYLQHDDLPDYILTVQVQPVTGQILIYQEE